MNNSLRQSYNQLQVYLRRSPADFFLNRKEIAKARPGTPHYWLASQVVDVSAERSEVEEIITPLRYCLAAYMHRFPDTGQTTVSAEQKAAAAKLYKLISVARKIVEARK